jgi:hypothetical protein
MSKQFDIYLDGRETFETRIGRAVVRVHSGSGPLQPGAYLKSVKKISDDKASRVSPPDDVETPPRLLSRRHFNLCTTS